MPCFQSASSAKSAVALSCLFVSFVVSLPAPARTAEPRLEFTRMVAHWAEYGDPDYLPFVFEAEPELVQLGFYGAHFYSLAHTPSYKGYPAHFPVQGLKECGEWFEEKNQKLHEKKIKVVGHFNVEFLVGDPDGPNGPTGFFKFYRDLWDEKELGVKPVADPLELLERGPDGKPITQDGYGIGGMKEYWGCLRNPAWQAVLKAWVKRGIERGVDGYIANYFYKHDCHCEHCQKEFREYLAEREKEVSGGFRDRTQKTFLEQLGIADLKTHKFEEMAYWHKPAESTPLKLEMLRWAQISNKRVFDKVFIDYGRSLKKDLIVAQWDHLGDFGQISGDERCLLPADLWGKGEDYLWYSTGGAAAATDIAAGNLGEGTLQARYIRGMFDDKPFTLGKYESTRTRVAIAELAANGGAPMGFYTRFKDPEARQEIVRYYQFLKRYDEIYRANRQHAEVALVYPRREVFQGGTAAVKQVESFKSLGKRFLDSHVLFDVKSNEGKAQIDRGIYPGMDAAGAIIDSWLRQDDPTRSHFDAPATVRVSASQPAKGHELDIHFVNYNRTEPPKGRDGQPSPGGGLKDEKPIEAPPIACDVVVPAGFRVTSVAAISPEQPEPATIAFSVEKGRVKFTLPKFLVYSVARVMLDEQPNWLWSTAHAIPKETTTEGSGYFSIIEGQNGHIYVGAAKYGFNAYLVEFDPAKKQMSIAVDCMKEIGSTATGFAAQAKIHTRNNIGKSGKIYFGTKQGYPKPNSDEKRTDYPGGYPMVYDPATGKTRVYEIPVPHQGIISVTPDESRGIAYISTCSDERPIESTHFMILNLETGKYRDLMDARHMYAFIVIDHLGRAYHPVLGGQIARYDPRTDKLGMLNQTVYGLPPSKESHLADEHAHPINWEVSPDRKTLWAVAMSGNELYSYDLTADGDTLAGRSHGKLVPNVAATDCRAMCVAPDGTVWAGVNATYENKESLLRLVSYKPGDKTCVDHGPIAVKNPDYTTFTGADGKPLPWHHGFYKYKDGTLLPRYTIMGICAAKDGTVYLTTLAPFTLHEIHVPKP